MSTSLKDLPPVYESWDMRHLDGLANEDIERLHMLLTTKINFLMDQYERHLFFTDRDRYIRIKEVELRRKKGLSSTRLHDIITMS